MTTLTIDSRTTLGTGALSTRYDEALRFAAEHHRTQCRKGSKVPYLSHLMSVSAPVSEHGGSEDQAIHAPGKPAEKSDDAVLVTAADKTHNALSIARDLRDHGTGFWTTFSACEHDLLWYCTAVEAAIAARLGEHTIETALHRAVDELIAAGGMRRDDVPEEPSVGGCTRHSRVLATVCREEEHR